MLALEQSVLFLFVDIERGKCIDKQVYLAIVLIPLYQDALRVRLYQIFLSFNCTLILKQIL